MTSYKVSSMSKGCPIPALSCGPVVMDMGVSTNTRLRLCKYFPGYNFVRVRIDESRIEDRASIVRVYGPLESTRPKSRYFAFEQIEKPRQVDI